MSAPSNTHHHHCHEYQDFKTTIKIETLTHLPYAIFSIAFGMIVLSFIQYFSSINGFIQSAAYRDSSLALFHSFHFLHLIFAATGTMITYLRFSNRLARGIVIGILSTLFFCALSDVIIPSIAGRALGAHVHFHFCILKEYYNVIPFLMLGILNGFLLAHRHSAVLNTFSVISHFLHICISSFASIFYLFSQGFTTWEANIGPLFLFLIFAVVFPCTFSDVVVPLYFARIKR